MANIFEQYQQAESGSGAPASSSYGSGPYRGNAEQLQEQVASTGYVETRRRDETPIFDRQIINFNPPASVLTIDISANAATLVLALADNHVYFIQLTNPQEPVRVSVTRRTEEKIHKVFLDNTGQHLIVAMESGENFYIHCPTRKPKSLAKAKGIVIESVAWNRSKVTETSTGEILIGSSKGIIYETDIAAHEGKFFDTSAEKYWKQLYQLGPEPVTGLLVEKFPRAPSMSGEKKYFIMATTPSRLYQFIGHVTTTEPPYFQWLFSNYDTNALKFVELPGSLNYSSLQVYPSDAVPHTFAWLTEPGVYYGSLDFRDQGPQDSVTSNCRLLRSPTQTSKTSPQFPVAIALTEFHALLLFKDRFEAICVLNDQVVYEKPINPRQTGGMRGMVHASRGGPLAYAEMRLYRYKVSRESRDIWKIYLEQGEYEKAKDYAKNDPVQMDYVLTRQAEHLFDEKKYDQSAALFAMTQRMFEEVALKFLRVQEREPLKTFLLKKFNSLKREDKTQQTMLVTWLIEIYLTQLGELKDKNAPAEDILRTQRHFRDFLRQPRVKACLDSSRNVAYELIASHGNTEDLVFFAMLMQDFERVISHYIQQQAYPAALEVLTKQSDVKLVIKFSPILIKHCPTALVEAWISLDKKIDPRFLIPALTHYEPQSPNPQANEAIRYLEYCVHKIGNKDMAIHNYLLSLYAKLEDDTALLHFLNLNQGQLHSEPCYDIKYALRQCAEHGRAQACVHLYSTMGLYEEAVDLALNVNVDLARLIANKPDESDEALRKKLWLKIARHVVEQEKNIKKAILFLSECDLLKIEDILPFFPDFVTIDDFKEAICNALQEYNEHIESLKGNMHAATHSAQGIRADIQEMRNKYGVVSASENCCICSYPLLTRSFYLFPCQHVYHSDCLIQEVLQHLSAKQKKRVLELQGRVAQESQAAAAADETGAVFSKVEQLKSELDDIVAADCVFCGEVMIKSIDKPFIDPKEYDDVLRSWL
ncbi:vacuolar protein sorting-associated protein 18 homolog [Sycon ciliatum]|uniref:vacuolar protein sorting-associated protein 18 homolog n=1 Tax=Sycon ciliatum TaxID=27933 RepID=UPI0020AD6E8B|eukprot:scpid10891/ scgid16186/ Vacuolar protein sorting-associated protein 18 homolog